MRVRGAICCLVFILLACDRTRAQSKESVPEVASTPSSIVLPADASSEAEARAGGDASLSGLEEESDARTGERKAILDGLRKEVQRQYAGSKTLASAELVFVVKTLRSDEKFAYVYAEAFRKTAAGNVKIVQKDFEGTKFATLSHEGVFDGPTVIAVLAKGKDGWRVARFPKGDDKGQLAIALGPTDFPGEYYLEIFGLPKAWVR